MVTSDIIIHPFVLNHAQLTVSRTYVRGPFYLNSCYFTHYTLLDIRRLTPHYQTIKIVKNVFLNNDNSCPNYPALSYVTAECKDFIGKNQLSHPSILIVKYCITLSSLSLVFSSSNSLVLSITCCLSLMFSSCNFETLSEFCCLSLMFSSCNFETLSEFCCLSLTFSSCNFETLSEFCCLSWMFSSCNFKTLSELCCLSLMFSSCSFETLSEFCCLSLTFSSCNSVTLSELCCLSLMISSCNFETLSELVV